LQHGQEQYRLHQGVAGVIRAHHGHHRVESEGVVRAKRNHEGVVIGRRLKFEVKGHAKLLAHRETERAVHSRAARTVHHEVRGARLVKEALHYQSVASRQGAKFLQRLLDVGGHLSRRLTIDPADSREVVHRRVEVARRQGLGEFFIEARH